MIDESFAGADTHVRLLAGHSGAGQPVFEVLPARTLGADAFELTGSPGLVPGCAAGDVLQVADDGTFEVTGPGANVCVQAYRGGPFSAEDLAGLAAGLTALNGLAEAPADRRFIVGTVARRVGLPAIERVMNDWAAGVHNVEWWFGNADRAGC
ncbi:DUF4265 domain-containing protein [Kitasatospora sp. NPDC088391]|uniref:DUF4265 domain-containing protein n=1 Tax=Kitasatospora sp. NPDC088391 TaxID=3364074 RepID=UPI00382B5CCA